MRFTKKQMDNWKEIFNREGPFQWDISCGYIIFGSEGMSVYKHRRGSWMYKHVNGWLKKTWKEINMEFDLQSWADAG